jgi:hypothetical protein
MTESIREDHSIKKVERARQVPVTLALDVSST